MRRRIAVGLACALGAAVCLNASSAARAQPPVPVQGLAAMITVPQRTNGHLVPRLALIDLPADVPKLTPVPLLLVLHGLYADATQAESFGFDRFADQEGIIVAYPYGYNSQHSGQQGWNADGCCGFSAKNRIADRQFLHDLIALIGKIRSIDKSRVYVAGFSNGGMMALKLACDDSDLFAAVAAVSSTLTSPCGARPTSSTLMINGVDDHTVPYYGARYSAFLSTHLRSIPNSFDILSRGNGCSGQAATRTSKATYLRFARCASGGEVELIRVNAVGHHWPSTDSAGFDGAEQIFSFLKRHTRGRSGG